MGHVSDFNGMNYCDESDLSQTPDLISADNILGLQLNENLMSISNSFPDDILQQSNLYAADDDRNGYFNTPMFDLLFESEHNFCIDFDAPDSILPDDSSILESDTSNNLETGESEENVNISEVENKSSFEKAIEVQKSQSEANSVSDLICDKKDVNIINNCELQTSDEAKTYTAETIFKTSNSPEVNDKQIPKLIIRLKPESKVPEQDFPSDFSAPMTIADNVKLGRRRNVNIKTDDSEQHSSIKSLDITHKKKSRHKRRQNSVDGMKYKITSINQNFKAKSQNSLSSQVSPKSMYKMEETASSSKGFQVSKTSSHYSTERIKSNTNGVLSSNTSLCDQETPPTVDTDFCSDEISYNDAADFELDNAVNEKENEQSLIIDGEDSFQFNFEDASIMPMSSSLDNHKELNGSVDDFLEHLEITMGSDNIPEFDESPIDDMVKVADSSKESSFASSTDEEQSSPVCKENGSVINRKPSNKGSSASELIDELHAHNQQVFEEIEISTPELEVELNTDTKNSIQIECPETSQSQNCANGNATKPDKAVTDHRENDMNSQNHLPSRRTSSCKAVPDLDSTIHNGTARPRNVSTSSSSITSKSSTSHRSYRKRRSRLSCSSGTSSDTEKFYNRAVKYDPVADTYCDKFGREVRRKHHNRHSKVHRDSHSNNGGSSSSTVSRSKSPRYRTHHRRRHKSRSSSRSHKKRRYSSSRSRSRSHGRKRKDNGERKYIRSPSPNHRGRKPHYMDLEENIKANEERRVMYVGDIPPGYTVEQLKERFGKFGPIQDATIKSKTTSDLSLYIFGFVTFKNRQDACNAIENGNNNPLWPKFDLNFGGRRRFCNGNYTDLDGKVAEDESGWYGRRPPYRNKPVKKEDDFAELLRLEQRRLGMSKK